MTGLTISIYAIVKSTTSNVSASFYGQTFEVKEFHPIHVVMNINGQDSILSFREVLVIDIENVYRQVKEEKEELGKFMGNRKTKPSKEYTDKQALIDKLFLCLKDYMIANQISIEL